MSSLSWRDLWWLTVSFCLSGYASGAFAAAVVVESRTLLDLPWLVIFGSVGLAMFGGLVGTLFAVHSAGQIEGSAAINIPLQVTMDLGRSAVLGLVAYAVVVINGWPPEVLLGTLPMLGVAGQKVMDPAVKAMTSGVTVLAERLAGKEKD